MNNFDDEFEVAIRLLTENMPDAEDLEKPTLFHSIRVGVHLYNLGYSRETCLAGLLHDVVEDADITKDDIEEEFGSEVALLVKANTKDEDLENKYEDLIERCVLAGEGALIIKAADVLDNYRYYTRINDDEGIGYVKMISQLLLKQRPDEFKDPIFEKLRLIK